MKRFIIPSVLLVTLLLATILHGQFLTRWTEQSARELEQAQLLASLGDWERATVKTQAVLQRWNDSHLYLHALLRHGDTDQIYRSFHSVLQYLALQEMDQYAAANTDLAVQLRLLAEMEQLSLANIL